MRTEDIKYKRDVAIRLAVFEAMKSLTIRGMDRAFTDELNKYGYDVVPHIVQANSVPSTGNRSLYLALAIYCAFVILLLFIILFIKDY